MIRCVRGTGVRIGKQLMVFAMTIIVMIMSIIPTLPIHAAESIQKVEDVDFSDFSNWRSGCYSWATGKYIGYNARICLKDYVTYSGNTYKVHITDTAYQILIRELDSNKNFIKSNTLANGDSFTPESRTKYLAIGIYKETGESGLTYNAYKSKFENGFVAELISTKNTTQTGSGSQATYYNIDTLDLNNFSNWRSGHYDYDTGIYNSKMTKRICLNKYATFSRGSYKISISKPEYHILIREMNSSMKFVKSFNLADGQIYTPSSTAKYLGISLYKTGEETTSYASMKQLFANGIQLKIKDNTINSSVTSTDKVYEILGKMITSGSMSKVDVSSYQIEYTIFFNEVIPKFSKNYVIEIASGKRLYANSSIQGKYIQSVWIENMDSNYVTRLGKVRRSIKEYLDLVDNRMSSIEKVLLAHEYIINHTEYKNDNAYCHYPAGPLGEGYGVCDGYALAMALLLNQVGIETNEVRSSSMNHVWLYVKLDGMWYHIDPTWDDTQKGNKEQYIHRFLIRNDQEFRTIYGTRPHYEWTVYNDYGSSSVTSTSTKYVNWFVHDVAGTMYYYNGMWYYWDMSTNSIKCSTISGSGTKVIVDGSGKDQIKLNGIKNGQMTYSIGNAQYTKSL